MNRDLLELIAALVVAALAAVGFVHAIGFPDASAYLPGAATGLAFVLALVWAGQAVRGLRRRAHIVQPDPAQLRRLGTIIAGSLVYVLAVGVIGFFTATVLFILLTAFALGLRRVRTLAVATVCFVAGLYLIFVVLLQRPLPPERLLELALGGS